MVGVWAIGVKCQPHGWGVGHRVKCQPHGWGAGHRSKVLASWLVCGQLASGVGCWPWSVGLMVGGAGHRGAVLASRLVCWPQVWCAGFKGKVQTSGMSCWPRPRGELPAQG